MGSSRTRDWTCVPCIGRRIINHWATREIPTFFLKSSHWITLVYKHAVIFLKKKVFSWSYFSYQLWPHFFPLFCPISFLSFERPTPSLSLPYQDHVKQPVTPLHTYNFLTGRQGNRPLPSDCFFSTSFAGANSSRFLALRGQGSASAPSFPIPFPLTFWVSSPSS